MSILKEIDACVSWIYDFVKENSIRKGVVLGLSGGVDSAVVAALCRRALPMKDDVLGLILPCESEQKDTQDALLVARELDLETVTIDLTRSYETVLNAWTSPRASYDEHFFAGNIKARLRMLMLYGFANDRKWLVAGTTNLSEYLVGYFTKYGDGGVDFEPIAEFYKTEVWEMAKLLGIPKEIIEKAPSAGLWEGQTDEKEMGISYIELDKMLIGEISMSDRVLDMIKNSEHKRNMPPCFEREQMSTLNKTLDAIPFEKLYIGMPIQSITTNAEGKIIALLSKEQYCINSKNKFDWVLGDDNQISIRWETGKFSQIFHCEGQYVISLK